MTTSKKLLELVPTIQATRLLKENIKKKDRENFAKRAIETILGTSLIKANADFIEGGDI